MAKFGIYGDIDSYSYPLAGRFILLAAVDTPMPSTVTPVENGAFPAGYSYLGATAKGLVTVSLNRTTQQVTTGVIETTVREILKSQGGKIETTLTKVEPVITGQALGQGSPIVTNASSPSRAYTSLGLGGTLGSRVALLVVEDWDIPLVKSDNSVSYEQSWLYAPRASSIGDIDLSDNNDNISTLKAAWSLFAYSNASFGSRSLLMEKRWLHVT